MVAKNVDETLHEVVDNLVENFEELQFQLRDGLTEIKEFKKTALSKASENTIAIYFNRISEALHRECGERPYTNKMNEESNLGDLFQTDDSLKLRENA